MSESRNRQFPQLWFWFFAFVWFAGWHFLHTWQVWQDPARRVPGPIGDNTVMLWNLGWVRHAFNHGHPGFWFPTAYYPEGFFFLFGTHTWLDGFLGWLISPLLPSDIGGPILWANVQMAVATVASGLLTILFLKTWGIRQWQILRFVSSAIVFSWFRMFALRGHYHFYGTQWMLLSLALLSQARVAVIQHPADQPRKLLIVAGLALGVSFLNDQTMAVFAGILSTLILLATHGGTSRSAWKTRFTCAVTFLGSALVPASIHIIPIIVAAIDGSLAYTVDTSFPRLVDASSLILPPPMHYLGPLVQETRDLHGLTWGEGTYLGIVQIGLLLLVSFAALKYAFSKPGHRPAHYRLCFYSALAASAFLVLALGDQLIIGRQSYGNLPGRFLKAIPVLNNIRLPQRWVWLAHLCIGLGGAWALVQLYQHKSKTWLLWAVAVAAVIPPLEALSYPWVPPVDFRNDQLLRPPGLVESVKNNYREGGVLMMPAEVAYSHSNLLQFQWGYEIPITLAYTARMPVKIQSLPWRQRQWTPAAGEWLKQKQVKMIVFPFHEGNVGEYAPWLQQAKKVVPELVILNRFGMQLTVQN